MKTDYLRIVNFWSVDTPDLPIKGIFHKWITKDDKTIALIEEFYSGRVAFIETQNMSFLNFWKTEEFWEEIKNKPI